jgi:protein O-GlcNAc transferase
MTCEALWMGVPVITLAGDRHACRVGGACCPRSASGGIAAGTEEYVLSAHLLGSRSELLAAARRGLRADMAASCPCNPAGSAHCVEQAYRAVWSIWCSETRA